VNLEILGYRDTRTLEKKRKKILSVSRELFIGTGIEQTSMKLIADKAEITRRSLYNYYESKDFIAIDVQMLNMIEVRFFQTWGAVIFQGALSGLLERIPDITRHLLNEYREHYIMISRFDSYFNNGYPDDRYVRFMQNGLSEYYAGSLQDIELSDYSDTWLKVNLLLSYLQRLVLRSQNTPLTYDDVREEIELLCTLIANSPK
jgi:AcrR family transcriptional regulator